MKVAYLKRAVPEGSREFFHDIFYILDTGEAFFIRGYWTERAGIFRGNTVELLSDQATLGQVKAIVECGEKEAVPPYSSLKIFEHEGKDIEEIVAEIQGLKKGKSSETTRRFIRRIESL